MTVVACGSPITIVSGVESGVFFDGSDGFMRGTWKLADNVPRGMTEDDALKVMVDVHVRGAQLLYKHKKYAIYSEHLTDTTAAQQQ